MSAELISRFLLSPHCPLSILPRQPRNLQHTAAQNILFFGGYGGFFDHGNPLHVIDGADDANRRIELPSVMFEGADDPERSRRAFSPAIAHRLRHTQIARLRSRVPHIIGKGYPLL